MPAQGHLVCGVQCKTKQEIKDLYKSLGKELTDVPDNPHELPGISFRDVQIDILEQITDYTREELEEIVVKKRNKKEISEMLFGPKGDNMEMGHKFKDYVYGVKLTGRYKPVLFDYKFPRGASGDICKISYEHLKIAVEKIREKIPNADLFIVEEYY